MYSGDGVLDTDRERSTLRGPDHRIRKTAVHRIPVTAFKDLVGIASGREACFGVSDMIARLGAFETLELRGVGVRGLRRKAKKNGQ